MTSKVSSKQKNHLNILKNQVGMSLIEILIAITLLGIVGGIVVKNVVDSLEEGKQGAARLQMQSFRSALVDFKRRCGFFPTEDQGLDALVEAPTSGRECKRYRSILEKVPLDPWDNPYVYKTDGRDYEIISLGADGFEGGDEFDRDISSKDE